MKILVTGGAGFIGSHLVDRFLQDGHSVAIVDDLSSGSASNICEAQNKGARFYKIDIRSQALADVFRKERPDIISHHAAQKSVSGSVQDPFLDADINILGLLNVLKLSKDFSGKHFIFASSGGVIYGESAKLPINEDAQESPLSPYGISKWSGEQYLKFYHREHHFSVASLRYANIYGPRQDPHGEAGVIAIFSNALIDQQAVQIFGDGEQTRDFVFVDDIADINSQMQNKLVQNRAPSFSIFNIGTAIETSVNSLYSMLSKFSDKSMAPQYKPARPGELRRSALSGEKIFEASHWKPKVPLNAGLKTTYEWFSSQKQKKTK